MPDALATLVDEQGLLGVAIIRRDGLPALASFRRGADEESFAAMLAAAWGACEAAASQWSRQAPQHAIVAGPDVAIGVTGLDDEMLVALVAASASTVQAALEPCRAAVQEVLGG